ncbi:MAG: hypothetical protein IPP90_11490 [Gemmatimonadaceae bacterium]|nr:hypothetical protein [Gemmatimonadaceae bacterium]
MHTMTRFTCATDARCDVANIQGFYPSPVTIAITIGARSTRHIVTPLVTLYYPNGPTCDPTCRKQSIRLAAP